LSSEHELAEKAAYLTDYLDTALDKLKNIPINNNTGDYAAFIHGQVYGIAMALRILFPGPGNWGEKAALKIRPVLTEHKCNCDEDQ